MKCTECHGTMSSRECEPWSSKYVCDKCHTYVVIDHHDLMSGCMVANTYNWFTHNGKQFMSYEEDRSKKIINIKEM